MPRSYIAWCSVGVLMVGVVAVVDVERVRQWGNGAPEAVGFRGEVGGTVRSLDAKTGAVRIARGMLDYSSIPISVTNDSRVNVRGRLGAFGDLHEGLSLSICYEVTPAGRWARSIEMPPSPAPCDAVAHAAPPEIPDDDPVRPIAAPVDPPTPAALVTRPAPVVGRPAPPAAQPRALEPATRSSEDYGAVIGRVLTERAAVARHSPTESALAGSAALGEGAPAPSSERAESPDLRSAALAPGSPAAPDATGSSGAPTAATPVGPEVAAPIASLEHRSGRAAIAKPACPDIAEVLQHDSSVDGRSRKQRIVDCVGGWLKGESEEIRDGFKRGIEEFRTEVDNLGRGLQRLGEKLRR